MWKTYGTHIVAELHRGFHLEDGDIIDEASVHILGMKYDLGDGPQLFIWGGKFSPPPQRAKAGYPIVILSPGDKMKYPILKLIF